MIDDEHKIFKRQQPWREAYYYQKADTLFQMTYAFCQRFLPPYGDRTVDQMIQAARSGKQNIIEGTEDGETSTEMHIKLLNVARGSLQELRGDYHDYLRTRNKSIWDASHPRYASMLSFCRTHNLPEDYQKYFLKWSDEEFCNAAITLCCMADALLHRRIIALEEDFVKNGGIKERMYAARTVYRKAQEEELARLRNQVSELTKEIERLREILRQHGIIEG